MLLKIFEATFGAVAVALGAAALIRHGAGIATEALRMVVGVS